MTAMKDRFAVGLTAKILRFAQDDKASFFSMTVSWLGGQRWAVDG
jgi:hypothetical protein